MYNNLQLVNQLKDQGNADFLNGKLDDSLKKYTQALSLKIRDEDIHERATLFSNRSAVYIRLDKYDLALEDAEECIRIRPDWSKGYFRKGSSLEKLNKFDESLRAFEQALRLSPESDELKMKISTLKKKIQDTGKQNQKKVEAEQNDCTSPKSWARGLSPEKQREWLVDCYRMRISDMYALQGLVLGLYLATAEYEKHYLIKEFLIFCKLLVVRRALPDNWNWEAFLQCSLNLLPYDFEKNDAKTKYGSENYFDPMTGGRSLRFTGEIIYESSVTPSPPSQAYSQLRSQVSSKWADIIRNKNFFSDIGGLDIWISLENKIKLAS